MLMRILRAPRRPTPTPTPAVGPVPSLVVSLSAHAALLVAVAGGGVAAGDRAATPTDRLASDGEQLHWVGLGRGEGAGVPRRAPRPGARPPLAYLVPGRSDAGTRGLRVANARGPGGRTPGGNGGSRDGEVRGSAEPRRPDVVGPRVRRARLGVVSLPAVPQVEVARLVAGVLAAAPDLARRVSRPEDFLPTPATPGSGLLQHVGAQAFAAVDAHATVLPIPLLGNPTPAYPAALARAGVGGRVVVEFLIDSTGVVDVASLRVVESTGALFADAVRRVLPRLHFLPGQLGAQAVGVTVRQPFLFVARGPAGGGPFAGMR